MAILKLIDLSHDSEKWSDLLNEFPFAGAGHLQEWGRIIKDAYGWNSICLAAVKGSEVRGILPMVFIKSRLFGRVLVSMPYLNDGGILAKDLDAELFLWSEAKTIMKKEKMSCLELRHNMNMNIDVNPRTDKISMILDLTGGKDDVWMKKIHRNVRNKVRKSEKSGVLVKEGAEWFDAFYDMHIINMQELGSPAHSKKFFREIVNTFKDRTKVYVAIVNGTVVGGKLVLYFRDTLYFLWVSSPIKYRKYAAVSLMDWRAIEDGIQNGFKHCDFGRSTVNSTHYEFKKKWGAELKQLYWHIYPQPASLEGNENSGQGKLELLSQIWRKMPTGLVRIIGPMLRGGLPQ